MMEGKNRDGTIHGGDGVTSRDQISGRSDILLKDLNWQTQAKYLERRFHSKNY